MAVLDISFLDVGRVWEYDTATADADPGAGKFRANNADPSLATQLFISDTSQGGQDLSDILLGYRSGDKALISQRGDSTRYQVYNVTGASVDAVGYVKIPVSADKSGLAFQNTIDAELELFYTHPVEAHLHTHASTTGQTADDHHAELHTIVSHSDTTATGAELETLTDASNADALHGHAHSALTGQTANDHHSQVHALGGADHTTATLAALNALISDATVDDASAFRTDDVAIHDNVAAEISAIALKATPAAADHVLIEDSAAADVKKRTTAAAVAAAGPPAAHVHTHASTTGQTADDHHAQLHAAAHSDGALDEVKVENVGATSTDTLKRFAPDGLGGVIADDVGSFQEVTDVGNLTTKKIGVDGGDPATALAGSDSAVFGTTSVNSGVTIKGATVQSLDLTNSPTGVLQQRISGLSAFKLQRFTLGGVATFDMTAFFGTRFEPVLHLGADLGSVSRNVRRGWIHHLAVGVLQVGDASATLDDELFITVDEPAAGNNDLFFPPSSGVPGFNGFWYKAEVQGAGAGNARFVPDGTDTINGGAPGAALVIPVGHHEAILEGTDWRVKSKDVIVTIREIFQTATDYGAINGDFRVRNIASTGAFRFTFSIPFDFVSLIDLVIRFKANGTNATAGVDLTSDYGATGEAFNNHSESQLGGTIPVTINILNELDISGVFSVISAGDHCGVTVDHKTVGFAMDYMQLRMKYNTV